MALISKEEYMYYSKGHKLLTRESWTWISLNQGKKVDEPHNILCVIREIEEPRGDLKEIMNYWQELLNDYQDDYDYITLEEVSIHRGCGDYNHEWYIVGQRKETSEELNLRLDEIKKEETAKLEAEQAKQKAKEEKEYQEFLKLQAKFKDKENK